MQADICFGHAGNNTKYVTGRTNGIILVNTETLRINICNYK